MKIRNLVDLFTILPEDEKIMVDVLRQIIVETLPKYCKEKISYNVPFFYGNKGICIIWPASIPGGRYQNPYGQIVNPNVPVIPYRIISFNRRIRALYVS